VMYYQYQSI